ncbi:MAG: hypothetical protein ABEJ57_01120 [Halobacteriaceae archaeon]
MGTRRRIQLAAPYLRRASGLAALGSVVYVGAATATTGAVGLGTVLQAAPYLFVGAVVWLSVSSGMPFRQFQFALVLLGTLFVGMSLVALQEWAASEAVASRTFLVLVPMNAVGLYWVVRGWWVQRRA